MPEIGSRQVCWWAVHEFVEPLLSAVGSWPTAGTPAWQDLVDDDPRKWAAVIDAGRHWALRLDAFGQDLADTSRDVSVSADWSAIGRNMLRRNGVYIPRRAA